MGGTAAGSAVGVAAGVWSHGRGRASRAVASRRARAWAVLAALALAACARPGARETELAPSAGPGGSGAASATANLAGTWRYDARLSGQGNRAMPMEGQRGGFGGGGGFGGRPGAGRPGSYPGGDPRDARDSVPQDAAARDSVAREMGRLEIEQTDSTVTFIAGQRSPLTVYTDWRETRIPGRYGPGDVTFVTGSWKRGRFEVRRVLPSRTVLVDTYEVSRDGSQLIVTTRVAERSEERGEILPREGRRVYTKVAAPQ